MPETQPLFTPLPPPPRGGVEQLTDTTTTIMLWPRVAHNYTALSKTCILGATGGGGTVAKDSFMHVKRVSNRSYGGTVSLAARRQEEALRLYPETSPTAWVGMCREKEEQEMHDTYDVFRILRSSLRSIVSPLTGDRATVERMTTLTL